jgi:protein SCO1/2
MRLLGALAGAMSALSFVGIAGTASASIDPGLATAPRMEFLPPPPGSYRLQNIQRVADAVLLDRTGQPVRLSAVTQGKITLLTFFYTYCVDPLGCPFAHTTLANLRDRVRGDRTLTGRVRFVSVSLDPTHDTPAAIASYSQEFTVDPKFEWRFLTARRVPDLLPVLNDFGQDVSVDVDEKGPCHTHAASHAEDVSDRRPRRGEGSLLAGLLTAASDVQRYQDTGAGGRRRALSALYRTRDKNPMSTKCRISTSRLSASKYSASSAPRNVGRASMARIPGATGADT